MYTTNAINFTLSETTILFSIHQHPTKSQASQGTMLNRKQGSTFRKHEFLKGISLFHSDLYFQHCNKAFDNYIKHYYLSSLLYQVNWIRPLRSLNFTENVQKVLGTMSLENSQNCRREFFSVDAGDVPAFSKVRVGVNGCAVSEQRADNGSSAFVSDQAMAFSSQSFDYVL